jgi:large subunit ribosomal protein L33
MREMITLECSVCGRRNYTGDKDKKRQKDRLLIQKFCKFCKKRTEHKEKK